MSVKVGQDQLLIDTQLLKAALSQKDEQAPLLDAFSLDLSDPYPRVRSTINPDSFIFIVAINNVREFEAYPVQKEIALARFAKNKIVISASIIRRPNNYNDPIYYEKQHVAKPYFDYVGFWLPRNSTDTIFICYELHYKSKSGEMQKPLQKIYSFWQGKANVLLQSETSAKSDKLRTFLLKHRYW